MEVFIYQVVIAVLILVAGAFGKKARNVVTIIICLFTIIAVFTFKLALLQFFTIFLAYYFSIGYQEKKVEEKKVEEKAVKKRKIKEKKEEFNYYVVDKKDEEKSGSSFGGCSILFIILSSILCTIYVFQKKAELKKESIEVKKDTVVNEKGRKIFVPAQDIIVDEVPNNNDVKDEVEEKDYLSRKDNFLEYNYDVNSGIESCVNDNLSFKYMYVIGLKKNSNNQIDKMLVQVTDKLTNEQKFIPISLINKFGKTILYESEFSNCNFVRSFITGFNMSKYIAEGDFGDFIVCDINFDGREDFAIKIDSGGNGGAFYGYYIMGVDGEYKLDAFLTNEIGYFPNEIDIANNTITTNIHADVCGYNETIYKYIYQTKKWKTIKSQYIDICN